MTGEIENLIDEFPQASNRRVEEIASILEGVISDIECRYPSEEDTDSAYECQNIPKARGLIELVRAWNVREGEGREGGINKVSKDLKTTFHQLCLVSTDP